MIVHSTHVGTHDDKTGSSIAVVSGKRQSMWGHGKCMAMPAMMSVY